MTDGQTQKKEIEELKDICVNMIQRITHLETQMQLMKTAVHYDH